MPVIYIFIKKTINHFKIIINYVIVIIINVINKLITLIINNKNIRRGEQMVTIRQMPINQYQTRENEVELREARNNLNLALRISQQISPWLQIDHMHFGTNLITMMVSDSSHPQTRELVFFNRNDDIQIIVNTLLLHRNQESEIVEIPDRRGITFYEASFLIIFCAAIHVINTFLFMG